MPPYRNKIIYVIVRYYHDGKKSLVEAHHTEEKARFNASKRINIRHDAGYIGIETVTLVDE